MKHMLQPSVLSGCLIAALGLVSSPMLQAAQEQVVTPNATAISADNGNPFSFTLGYSTGDGVNKLTGLGLRMHYDSTKVKWVDNSSVFMTKLLAADTTSQPDTEDFDHNPSTDRYVGIAWMSSTGRWPGVELPITLYQANFVSKLAPGQSTQINLTSSGSATGYGFSSTPITVSANPGN